ncbi:hypothetical protein V1509DRAFT_607695 [Lipomyces kononenkoae]
MSVNATKDGSQEQQPMVPRRPMTPSIPRRPRPRNTDSGSDGSLSSSLPATPFSEQNPYQEVGVSERSTVPEDNAQLQSQLARSLPVAIPSIPRRPQSPSVNLRRPRDLYESQQQVAEIEMDMSRTLAENEKNFGDKTETPTNQPPGIYDGMEHIGGLLDRHDQETDANASASESYNEVELSESESPETNAITDNDIDGLQSPQPQNPRGIQTELAPVANSAASHDSVKSPIPRIPDRPRSSNRTNSERLTSSTRAEEHSSDHPISQQPTSPAEASEIPLSPKASDLPPSGSETYESNSPDQAIEQAVVPEIPRRPASRPTKNHANMHVHVSASAIAIDPSGDAGPGQVHSIPTFVPETDSDLLPQDLAERSDANTVLDIAAQMADEELHHPAELADRFGRTVLKRPDPLAGLLEPTATPADMSPVAERPTQEAELVSPTETEGGGQRDILESLIHSYMDEGTPVSEEPTTSLVTEKGDITDNVRNEGDAPLLEPAAIQEVAGRIAEPSAEGEQEQSPSHEPAQSGQIPDELTVSVAEGKPAIADTKVGGADDATGTVEPKADDNDSSMVTEPAVASEPPLAESAVGGRVEKLFFPDDKKKSVQPEIPRRPSRPQVPRRPKPVLALSPTGLGTSQEPAGGISPKEIEATPSKPTGEEAVDGEGAPAIRKPKPTPPARPNKLSGIRAAFVKDLESRFGKSGPMPFMMPRPSRPPPVSPPAAAEVSEVEATQSTEDRPAPVTEPTNTSVSTVRETKLDDVRKGRARGPRGRKLPAPTELPNAWGFSSVVTVWELSEVDIQKSTEELNAATTTTAAITATTATSPEDEITAEDEDDNKPPDSELRSTIGDDGAGLETPEEPNSVVSTTLESEIPRPSVGDRASEMVDEAETLTESATQEQPPSTIQLEAPMSATVPEVQAESPLKEDDQDNENDLDHDHDHDEAAER